MSRVFNTGGHALVPLPSLPGDALEAGLKTSPPSGCDEVVEDNGVGDAGVVASQGVGVGAGGFGDVDQMQELGG